ncbi:MAG: ComF family protein [Algoriphagus sp.]|uniref:ComF family protein n=1 Tax=Algoriphagus sp. TaxID=1872435 RepID=UPI002715D3EB|nr:ComF family protein [Algoriphagus sp.]MDO8966553.1 ComF family protein [Algoriphagus sp.]MDP2040896.1 ComF family protein [Algoriphagus sp.]MDP3201999.1 ComF family protein [Algoriphagus sp.]MDP3471617.1 ComF family protein [Algoriphagus sp.]
MRLIFWKDFLDLIFPRNCPQCGRSLFDFEQCLCTICQGSLPVANFHLRPYDNELTSKIRGLTKVNRVMAYLRFSKKGKSQKLLHQLKYKNKPEIGEEMGRLYGLLLSQNGYLKEWDLIVPVPLHPMKQKRRGFNQSEKFALGLAKPLDLAVENLLERRKFTETQTKKSRLERLENVDEVFGLRQGENISGMRILLVDDVITTGATLCACSNVLLANGAKHVDLVTIAAGGQ